jgi:threonylcarbamoyladenosine tRNA methylthiotransferase MtaB
MPQLARATIRERASRLRAHGAERLAKRLKDLLGGEQSVLVEEAGRGRTPCFAAVRFREVAEPGALLRMRIKSAAADHVTAESVA